MSFTPVPFSDYQPILDRMPFGPLPAHFDQTAADPAQQLTDAQLQAEQQKLAKQVNMSAVTVTPNGMTAIGFTDLSEKPPTSYYLLVGDTAGGWTVVAADYDEEWAQIEKDGVTITLQLGKGLIDGPPVRAEPVAVAQAPNAPAAPTAITAERLPSPASGRITLGSQAGRALLPNMPFLRNQLSDVRRTREDLTTIREEGGDVNSYMERLRERKTQEKAEQAVAEQAAREKLQNLAQKITQEELARREREINLDLISQGAKPVSDIELTTEEEQALIEKGVLAQ